MIVVRVTGTQVRTRSSSNPWTATVSKLAGYPANNIRPLGRPSTIAAVLGCIVTNGAAARNGLRGRGTPYPYQYGNRVSEQLDASCRPQVAAIMGRSSIRAPSGYRPVGTLQRLPAGGLDLPEEPCRAHA